MSDIKLQNEDSQLISSVDVNSERTSYRSSRCSCLDCDYLSCFAKRNKAVKEVCQCGICRDLKNCLSVTHKASEEEKVGDRKENPPKKIIRETVTRETIESLKKVTETMYEIGNTDKFEMMTERPSKINKDKPMDYGNMGKTMKNNARSKETDNAKKTDKSDCCKKIPIAQGPSSNELPQKDNDTATKLSAQVMNVPYDELHESAPSNEILEHSPISKLNIFKRIKEIYDACSCKVCECISSKRLPLRDPNVCQCKPCECQDCTNLRMKIDDNIRRFPHSGCPCVRCDRKDCRGIVKNAAELQVCDCKPSECIQRTESFSKPCNCEPCQCINCKKINSRVKTVKLSHVDEVFHGESCKCSPCECIECKQIYSRTNPTIMCTTSTEITRYQNCQCANCTSERCRFVENESCKCGRRNNRMQNPFEKNNNYDIRTVIVNNKGPFEQPKHIFENHDTIAFFASLENKYPQNIRNKNVCKCIDCECIACAAKDEALKRDRDTLLRSNVQILKHAVTMPTPNMNACKCSPCECEICSQRSRPDTLVMQSKCSCDVCDCLNCDEVSLPTCSTTPHKTVTPIKFSELNNNCNCHPCECRNCKDFLSCTSNVKFYSDGKSFGSKKVHRLRKVMLISPSSSAKYFNSQKTCDRTVSSITLSPKKSTEAVYEQNVSTRHSTFQNDHSLLSHSKCHAKDTRHHNDQIYDNDNDLTLNVDFNSNTQALEISSCTSIRNEPSITPTNSVKRNTLESNVTLCHVTPDKTSEFKNLNIIHETPVKISNDSEESLPVLWACDQTLHPSSISPEWTALTPCVKNNLRDSSTSIENIHRNTINTEKTLTDDSFLEYPKYSHNDWDYDCIFNNEQDVLRLQSQKYCNPFSTSQRLTNKASYRSPTANHFDLSTCYQRATKVLHEAKAFSAKLIKMLDSFEAANRNFKSASQKFKNLHMTLLNINETEVDKNYNKTLKTHTDTYEPTTFENKIENYPLEQQEKIRNENEAEKEYEQSTRSTGHYNKRFNILNQDILKAKESNPIVKIKSLIMYTSENNIEPIHDNTLVAIGVPKQESNSKIIKEDVDTEEPGKTNFRSNKDIYLYSPSNTDIEVNNLIEANCNEQIETQSNNDWKEDAKLIKKLDSVFGKETTVDTAIETDDIEKMKKGLEQEAEKWDVFKKNLFLNGTPAEINRKMFGLPELEWNIKEAVQAISSQTPQKDVQNLVPTANEALTKLQSEVSNLLNMPILQSNSQDKYKTEMVEDACYLKKREKMDLERKRMLITVSSQTYDNYQNHYLTKVDKEVYFNSDHNAEDHFNRRSRHYGFHRSYSPFNRKTKSSSRKMNETEDRSRISTRKSSCEDLKTSFVGLRRVSDHTVLVKWNLPKRMKDVQGYELLVDGRAVQKIFSPTRSMAVVTCLPNADHVLLTIHTIATTTACGHTPATSIVYRPRIK